MKLYQAMIKSMDLIPQSFGLLYRGDGSACAMGTVRIACGEEHPGDKAYTGSLKFEKEKFPELFKMFHLNELINESKNGNVCNNSMCKLDIMSDFYSLRNYILHLNDGHKLTRLQIANWLIGLEEKGFVKFTDWEPKEDNENEETMKVNQGGRNVL